MQSEYRPYDDAVKFVHPLGSQEAQRNGSRIVAVSGRTCRPKPTDIPVDPSQVYGEEFRERGGMGAWLGTGTICRRQSAVSSI